MAHVRPGPEPLLPLLGVYLIFIAVFWYLIVASPMFGLGLPSSIPSAMSGPAVSSAAHPTVVSLSSLVLTPQLANPNQGAAGGTEWRHSALDPESSSPAQ